MLQEIVITLFSVQPNKSQDVQRATRSKALASASPLCCSNINYLTREFSSPTFIPIESYGSLTAPASLSSMDSSLSLSSLYSRQWSDAHCCGWVWLDKDGRMYIYIRHNIPQQTTKQIFTIHIAITTLTPSLPWHIQHQTCKRSWEDLGNCVSLFPLSLNNFCLFSECVNLLKFGKK